MQLNSRILKYQNNLLKKNMLSYVYFYAIMYLIVIIQYLSINIINMPINFISIGISHNSLTSVAASSFFISPIMIIIFGIIEYYENFALAFSLSATRKKYYLSAMYSNLIVSLGFSIIATIMFFLDESIVSALGMNALTDFFIFDTSVDGPLKVFIILFGINLSSISIGNFMGTLQYKFGYKFWIAFGIFFTITMILLPTIITLNSPIFYIIKMLIDFIEMTVQSIGLVPAIVIYGIIQTIILYVASFFIIKSVNMGK